ncbi:shikimate kinase [Romboutsia maritimum]|uniref:Shikimate kinase n=1 Tax=Romboutsia maritimum TaxID=2020948 RepID=A0A371IWG3_9FIRM|nr:shikimate kinase [Romboutsia maritimum]RDY24812.1 shikimate kinase [Romboutsia maritimum]
MRIILIGFMGTGKSVVGKKLSQIKNVEFVDMDNEIEKVQGVSISYIFEKYGQEYFRNLETNLLKELLLRDNIIISTGGGIITNKGNIEILKKEDKVIFLDANVETIVKNVSREINKRPLLKESSNLNNTIKTLLSDRYEKYKKIANFIIDINEKNIEEVVSQILVSIG